MAGLRIVMPTVLLSGNVLRSMHWARQYRYGKALELEVWALLMAQMHGPVERATGRKHVTVTLYHRARRFDQDNAHRAAKPLLDALRRLGLIRNDSRRWLDLDIEQEVDRERPCTVVEIDDAGKEGGK